MINYNFQKKDKASQRLIEFMIIIVIMFTILIFRLIYLQIINGEKYLNEVRATIYRDLNVKAPRGNIYDKYGNTLANNKVAYNVKFDGSMKQISTKDKNEIFLEVFDILEKNDEKIYLNFPISVKKPYEYILSNSDRWKKEMNIEEKTTASEAIEKLKKRFELTEIKDSINLNRLLAIYSELYKNRYRQYKPVLISKDVKKNTMLIIEEKNNILKGIYVDEEPVRVYNNPKETAHILGYTSLISKKELEENPTYKSSDFFGKLGIEKVFEQSLSGEDGKLKVEVDKDGRRIKNIETKKIEKGEDLTLTIDLNLQKTSYNILKNKISELLAGNLKTEAYANTSELYFTKEEAISNLVKYDYVDINKILNSDQKYSRRIKSTLDYYFKNKNENQQKEILSNLLLNKKISLKYFVLSLMENNILKSDYKKSLENGYITTYWAIKKMLEDSIISPEMTAKVPYEGSVVILNANDGSILTLTNYPSYDNNNFAYNYSKVINRPTKQYENRALNASNAPGSIFKMVSAVAALEENLINSETLIKDEGIFKKVGRPYAKNWKYVRHGRTDGEINVIDAIARSNNYFFYEIAYRFGYDSKNNKYIPKKSTEIVNKYAEKFGLFEKTGFELSSQEKIRKFDLDNFSDWNAGDDIRGIIGQGKYTFSPIQIARYISIIAADGYKKNIHIVNNDNKSEEEKIDIKDKNINIVKTGMHEATSTSDGTVSYIFRNTPVEVAGKTGTAQSGGLGSHGWFGGYAPYEKPEIVIVVMLPHSGSSTHATLVAEEIISEYYKEVDFNKRNLKNNLIK